MNVRRLIGGVLAGVVLFGAMPADAKSCRELVADKAYRCTAVRPDGTTEERCARFLPLRDDVAGLRLLVDGYRTMACACEHSGSINRPRFGASAEIACTGNAVVFTGKATKTKLDKVFSRDVRGRSAFAAVCVLDTTCSISD